MYYPNFLPSNAVFQLGISLFHWCTQRSYVLDDFDIPKYMKVTFCSETQNNDKKYICRRPAVFPPFRLIFVFACFQTSLKSLRKMASIPEAAKENNNQLELTQAQLNDLMEATGNTEQEIREMYGKSI